METSSAAHLSPRLLPITVYSEVYWRALATSLYLISMFVLGSMLTRRTPPWKDWIKLRIQPVKVATFLILTDSTLYVFASSLLLLGVGTSMSAAVCLASGWLCLTLYAGAKAMITFFLIERVHIVLGQGTRRRESKLYLTNCCVIFLWIVAFTLLVIYHNAYFRPADDACMLETKQFGVIVTAGVDVFINLYLCLLFAVPLYRGKWANPILQRLAVRSLVVSLISMTSSVTNMTVMSAFHGEELASMCLTTCCLDTLINATGIFVVTGQSSGDSDNSSFVASLRPQTSTDQRFAPTGIRSVNPIASSNGPRLGRWDDKTERDAPFLDLVALSKEPTTVEKSEDRPSVSYMS